MKNGEIIIINVSPWRHVDINMDVGHNIKCKNPDKYINWKKITIHVYRSLIEKYIKYSVDYVVL